MRRRSTDVYKFIRSLWCGVYIRDLIVVLSSIVYVYVYTCMRLYTIWYTSYSIQREQGIHRSLEPVAWKLLLKNRSGIVKLSIYITEYYIV